LNQRFAHGDEEHKRILAEVDALASQSLDWVAPIKFSTAQSEAERVAVYRLRYNAVIEHGWLPPADLPGGIERDDYDNIAIHVVGWDGNTLAATSRLILPKPGLILPTEKAFDILVEPRDQVVDASRFVVARPYSSIEHRVLAVLLAKTWLVMREHGYEMACAAFASLAMLRVYRWMGFHVTVLGPARPYWGEDRYPLLYDVAEATPSLIARWDQSQGNMRPAA
jgi:N-acyl-L-homoserine lactone synthetase